MCWYLAPSFNIKKTFMEITTLGAKERAQRQGNLKNKNKIYSFKHQFKLVKNQTKLVCCEWQRSPFLRIIMDICGSTRNIV
jgi:hypothetical protein